MDAEVIAIGDEIISGQRVDTNSAWLSERLEDLGLRVRFHSTVADDLEPNTEVFRQAFLRADVVLSTGGLGPTEDDLTREALSQALQSPLVIDPVSLEHITQLFARRKREMPERNRVQAMFPAGCTAIPNPHGTAPGIAAEIPREGRPPVLLFALPGVPSEMRRMWDDTVSPRIAGAFGQLPRRQRYRLKCFGAGESEVERRLPDLIRRGRNPLVGITVHEATISLRILAEGTDENACRAAIEKTRVEIRQHLGHLVFGEEDDELEDTVCRRLEANGQTLATVEIGVAGHLHQWLTRAAGTTGIYKAGLGLFDSQEAARLLRLGGPAKSAIDLRQVAEHWRRQAESDYCLVLASLGEQEEGLQAEAALAGPESSNRLPIQALGHPNIRQAWIAKTALNWLRRRLEKSSGALQS